MVTYKNSLVLSIESLYRLSEYKTLPLEDFQKYVDTIIIIHKKEFGLSKTYLKYLDEFKGKEDDNRKEIVEKMADFVSLLQKKG